MTDPRDLIQRLYGALRNQPDDNGVYRQVLAEARAYLDAKIPTDEGLLFTFYEASLSDGGDTDEVTLRGLRAVLARYCNQHPTSETH